MSISPIEVISKFNSIKDKYRNLYFDIYTVLLMYDWRPLDDYIGHDNFDFLVSSELYDSYMFSEKDCSYSEVIDAENKESFEVEIFDCKNVKPPKDYVCAIKNFSNINIEEALKKYAEEMLNYGKEVDTFFISNGWIKMVIEDAEEYEKENGDGVDLDIYVSPFMQFNIDENNEINKSNIKSILDNCPNIVVYINLWWDYDFGLV